VAEDERVVVVVLDICVPAAGANAEAAVAVKKRVSSFMIVVVPNRNGLAFAFATDCFDSIIALLSYH